MSYFPASRSAGSNIKNILVNGGLEIWQRGTPFASPAVNAFTADKWQADKNGTPTFSIAEETGASNVDNGGSSLKLDITVVGAATVVDLFQEVENKEAYKGKTITLSAKVKTSQANLYRLRINDGIGTTTSSYHTGGGTFETLTVTHDVSGSATQLNIEMGIINDTVLVSTAFFDSVMLVLGNSAVSFVPEDPMIEFTRCERYFEFNRFQTNYLDPIFLSSTVESVQQSYYFKTFKAATPTITLTKTDITLINSPSQGAGLTNTDGANWTLIADNLNLDGFRVTSSATSNRTRNNMVRNFKWEAEG